MKVIKFNKESRGFYGPIGYSSEHVLSTLILHIKIALASFLYTENKLYLAKLCYFEIVYVN